jgi:hypothetical protein
MLSNNPLDYSTQPPPKKRRSVWPFIVVGLLAAHAGGMLFVVSLTQRNKPPVIDNYYEKAVNWDRDRGRVVE